MAILLLISCRAEVKPDKTGWISWQDGYEYLRIDSSNYIMRDLDSKGNLRSVLILNENTQKGVQLIYIGNSIKYMGQFGFSSNKFVDIDSLTGDSVKLLIFNGM